MLKIAENQKKISKIQKKMKIRPQQKVKNKAFFAKHQNVPNKLQKHFFSFAVLIQQT